MPARTRSVGCGQDIPGFYERFSYDVGIRDWRLANPRHVQLRLLTREALAGASAGRRILDVGCGTGVMTACLRRYGALTAVDYSEAALALARRFLPDVRFIPGSLEEAALPPASFDIITLFDVTEHIPQDDRQSFLEAAATAPAVLLLTARFGVTGAAIGMVFGCAAQLVCQTWLTRPYVHGIFWRLWPPRQVTGLALAYAASFFVARAMDPGNGQFLRLLLDLVTASIVYVVVLVVGGGVLPRDRDRARAVWARASAALPSLRERRPA